MLRRLRARITLLAALLTGAVLTGAQALFLDEPFKGLDEHTRADTIRYLRRHTAGATVVLVTHSPEEAAAMGARVVTIKEAGA